MEVHNLDNRGNQASCKHCLATFTDPFGIAKLSHHLLTFHFNQNLENHMASPHSNMATPGHLGTPGLPGLVGQNRQTATLTPPISPEILFQYPISRRRPNSEANGFGKRKLKIDVKSLKKRKIDHSFSLKRFFEKFPTLEEKICNQLDLQSLTAFTQVSKEMVDMRLRRRFYWVSLVRYKLGSVGYGEKIPKEWSKVIQRSPMEIVREFAQTIDEFYHFSSKIKSIFLGQIEIGYIPIKCSPLHIAAERGNFELCQHIIGRLEDKNPKDSFGETPLHWAAERGLYSVCKLILENTSNKNPKDDAGITPLHLAAAQSHLELYKLITNNLEKNSEKNPKTVCGGIALHFAAAAPLCDLELCKLIIENLKKNGDKRLKDDDGITPLHLAAEKGDLELCKLIVQNVTNKSPLTNKQETPSDLAYQKGHVYLSEILSLYALS